MQADVGDCGSDEPRQRTTAARNAAASLRHWAVQGVCRRSIPNSSHNSRGFPLRKTCNFEPSVLVFLMEVAGVVLGTMPVLLAAVKQYHSLYKLCKRFGKCKAGVEELIHALKLQTLIFQNETQLLLTAAVGARLADSMMRNNQDKAWLEPETEARLHLLLGESKTAVRNLARNIVEGMKKMEGEIESLYVEEESTNTKAYRKELRSRFRYTFSENKLRSLAQSIRQATADYRSLRSQVTEINSTKVDALSTKASDDSIAQVKATQAALKQVYEVLARACKLHTKHRAHFSLQPTYKSSSSGLEVQFQIAYRRPPQHHNIGNGDDLWFVIETIFSGTVSTVPAPLPQLTSRPDPGRRRSRSPESPVESARHRLKRVRFRSRSPYQRSLDHAALSSPCIQHQQQAPAITHDFCTHLETCGKNVEGGSCIGLLEHSAQWIHRILYSTGPWPDVRQSAFEGKSLAHLLAMMESSGPGARHLTIRQRLRLGELLSTAVMNFHATPWMQSFWSSDDIILYNRQQPRTMTAEQCAFVDVCVRQASEVEAQQDGNPDVISPFVHNTALFGLGVMLLELAFEKPLRSMRDDVDSVAGMPPAMTDLYTAFRLRKEIPTTLGITYTKVVEKCLRCDFGQGSELNNPALQRAVQRDVVSALAKLENGFHELGIS